MTTCHCRLTVAQGAASFELLVDVSTNSTWRVTRPLGWCPGSGRWNASERVGMGGSI